MTIPTSYNAIIQSVQEELEDSGSEFVLNIPSAIRMAEDRINRDVDGIYQNISGTLNVGIGNQQVIKPDGYRFAYNLFIRPSVGGSRTLLKKMSKDFLTDYWPTQSNQAFPKYYADNTATTFQLAPTPDANYTIEIDYATNPPYLTSSNQTNTIINKYPDLLWFGVLSEQTRFSRMFEAQTLYEAKYQEILQRVREETRRERADNTYLVGTNYFTQNRMDKQG